MLPITILIKSSCPICSALSIAATAAYDNKNKVMTSQQIIDLDADSDVEFAPATSPNPGSHNRNEHKPSQ